MEDKKTHIEFSSMPIVSFEHDPVNTKAFIDHSSKEQMEFSINYDPGFDFNALLPETGERPYERLAIHFRNGDRYETEAKIDDYVVTPDGWFQAFKERWFPKWLKRLFPVRWCCEIKFKCKAGTETYVTKESKDDLTT